MKRLLLAFAATLAFTGLAEAVNYPGYPPNALPVVIDSANVATGPIAITMPAVAGWTNYLAGVACTGSGATAASNVLMVLGSFPVFPSGTVNLTWIYEVPVGATVAAPGVAAAFNPPLIGQDGGAIALNVPSIGAGNTHFSCNMRGYRIPSPPS